jgi:hypothetical protein
LFFKKKKKKQTAVLKVPYSERGSKATNVACPI